MSNYTRWYKEGTIAVTKGSATITGTSTYWGTAGLNPGDIVKIAGVDYELASVTDNTHLVLATNYAGNTASGLTYSIVRNFTATSGANVAAQAAKLLGDVERHIDTDMQKITGKSAYEIAKENGYTGTAAQWLESLKAAGEWSSAKSRLDAVEAKNTTQDTTLSSHTTSINNFTIWTKGLTVNNAMSHNSIVRGKNLGAFTAAHSAAIQAGTFDDMFLGDYFTMPSGFTPTYWKDPDWGIPNFRIAGFRHWGSSSGLLLIADVAFKSTVGMWHDNDYTEGYAACKWREVDKPLLEAEAANIFIDETHLVKHYEKLTGATNENGVVSAMVTVSDSCVEIPSLTQIFGYTYKNDTTNLTGNTDTPMEGQFELFRHMNPSLVLGAPWGGALRTVSHHYTNFGFNPNPQYGLGSESGVTNAFRSWPYITVK